MFKFFNRTLTVIIIILLVPIIFLYTESFDLSTKKPSIPNKIPENISTNINSIGNTINNNNNTNIPKNVPTLEQIKLCEAGIVNEPPLALSHAESLHNAYGTIASKPGNNMLVVKDYFSGNNIEVDLTKVATIYFYMIYDREDYLNRVNYEYLKTSNNNPYRVDEVYQSVPTGVHVWVWSENKTDTWVIYCPIEKSIL